MFANNTALAANNYQGALEIIKHFKKSAEV